MSRHVHLTFTPKRNTQPAGMLTGTHSNRDLFNLNRRFWFIVQTEVKQPNVTIYVFILYKIKRSKQKQQYRWLQL